jgi:hypothetical protein
MFLLLATGVSARADYFFDFNPLSVSSGDNSGAVGTYMSGLFGGTVTVTGAATNQKYNGDGFVTGPGSGSISLTLGTSDGATASNTSPSLLNMSNGHVAYDTFISTTVENSDGTANSKISSEIDMTFSHAVTGVVSFDFEIFPDISGAPDFAFNAFNGLVQTATFSQLGLTPGTTNGTSTKSPKSSNETNKQYIGTWSSLSPITFTTLKFIDWPATIAVDNLRISQVPEPRGGALILGAFVIVGLAGNKLRRAFAKS